MSAGTTGDRRIAGVELGGTKCIAVLAEGDAIVARNQIATGRPGPTLAALTATVDAWHAAAPLAALGIASFGPLVLDPANAAFGRIAATTKPDWSHVDVRGAFAGLDIPIGFDTDVGGAALAEGHWGAAQGCADFFYLTIGTGVGAGIVAGGQLVHGRGHPEAGHLRVRRAPGDAFAGACSFHGDCLEGLISGPALAARTGLAGDAIPDDHPVWAAAAADLAEALASFIVILAPQRIVIGGGVATRRPGLVIRAATLTRTLLGGYLAGYDGDLDATVVPAALGSDAGPRGAIALGAVALAAAGGAA